MLKKLLPLLLLAAWQNVVQAQTERSTTHLTISPIEKASSNPGRNEPLNVSDLIPVHKGDEFKMIPNISPMPPQRHFLKGLLKTIGIGALTYEAENTYTRLNTNGKTPSKTVTGKSLIIPAGVGLAVGLPDMIKAAGRDNLALTYTLYGKDRSFIESRDVILNRKNILPVLYRIPADGYLEVAVYGNRKRVIPGDLSIVADRLVDKRRFKGSIAGSMQMDATGDCLGGGGGATIPPPDPESGDASGNDPCHCYAICAACEMVAYSAAVVAAQPVRSPARA